MKKKTIAFTLAEVLITLTIIGVIAALTIPNLMQKWEDQQTVSGVKEAYSILNNAYKLCIAENGTLDSWNLDGSGNKLAECMLPYLKVKKYCGSVPDKECWNGPSEYKNLNDISAWGMWTATSGLVSGMMKLQNGMYVSKPYGGMGVDNNGNTYQHGPPPIRVDINGEKGPNRFGYDVFFFKPMRNGIEPGSGTYHKSEYCTRYKHPQSGQEWVDGVSCASWIIKHSNADYKYISDDEIIARW